MAFAAELVIILIMLVLNAIFASYEMALASISHMKLSSLVSQKKKGAKEAAFMKDRMEASLAVVQLGITLFGAIAAAVGGAGVQESLTPFLRDFFGFSKLLSELIALIIFIIPLSSFIIIFAELVPKMFALNNKEFVCLKLSPVMKALSLLAYPVVRIFEYIVKKISRVGIREINTEIIKEELHGLYELKAAASLARAARLIGAHEEKIVLSAAYLSARHIKEIMIPVNDISIIPIDSTLNDALIRAHLDMHTRFPVAAKENDPQAINGYVNFKDIVFAIKMNVADPTVRGITRTISRIDSMMPISQVLTHMMQNKTHIALVVSKENIVLGLITLEDILEELVGEIEDEFDRLSTNIQPYGSAWLVGGGVLMKAISKKLEIEDFKEDSPESSLTLSDWCVGKLGKPVEGGEVIEDKNILVIVRKLRRKRLSEAVVSKR